MIDFSLSWLPFIFVAVANFAVSWLYYSPAMPWFKTWQVGIGVDTKKGMTEADMRKFLLEVRSQPVDLRSLGIARSSLDDVLEQLGRIYCEPPAQGAG